MSTAPRCAIIDRPSGRQPAIGYKIPRQKKRKHRTALPSRYSKSGDETTTVIAEGELANPYGLIAFASRTASNEAAASRLLIIRKD